MKTGYRPSAIDAFKAKCCECSANYLDGRTDCQIIRCPLYSRHPYRKLKPNYEWLFGRAFIKRMYEAEMINLNMTIDEYVRTHVMNSRGKLSVNMIVRGKCFWCCGDFRGGMPREDCGITDCALYYWMPYRTQLPTYDWMFDLSYTNKHRVAATMSGCMNPDGTINRPKYIKMLMERQK